MDYTGEDLFDYEPRKSSLTMLHRKPIIIAVCCAVAIVVGAYLWGSLIFDQGQEDNTPAETTNSQSDPTAYTGETKPVSTETIGTPEENTDRRVLKKTEGSPTDDAEGLEPVVPFLPDDFVLEKIPPKICPSRPLVLDLTPEIPIFDRHLHVPITQQPEPEN